MFGFFRKTKKNTPDKKSPKKSPKNNDKIEENDLVKDLPISEEEFNKLMKESSNLIKEISISEEEKKKIMDEMEQYEKENEKITKRISKNNENWDDEELLKELEKLIEEEEKKEGKKQKRGGYKLKKPKKMRGGTNFKDFFLAKIANKSPKLQILLIKYYNSNAHLFINRDLNKLLADSEYYNNRLKNIVDIDDKTLKYFYTCILFLVKSIIEFKNNNSRTKSISAGYTKKINKNKYRKT
jgi:hypothetical protein